MPGQFLASFDVLSGGGNLSNRLVFAGAKWERLDLRIHGQQLRWHCAECDEYFKERQKAKPKKRD